MTLLTLVLLFTLLASDGLWLLLAPTHPPEPPGLIALGYHDAQGACEAARAASRSPAYLVCLPVRWLGGAAVRFPTAAEREWHLGGRAQPRAQ